MVGVGIWCNVIKDTRCYRYVVYWIISAIVYAYMMQCSNGVFGMWCDAHMVLRHCTKHMMWKKTIRITNDDINLKLSLWRNIRDLMQLCYTTHTLCNIFIAQCIHATTYSSCNNLFFIHITLLHHLCHCSYLWNLHLM